MGAKHIENKIRVGGDQWWIQDFQKGKGGHKIMDACCLYKHTFFITTTKGQI